MPREVVGFLLVCAFLAVYFASLAERAGMPRPPDGEAPGLLAQPDPAARPTP